MSIHATAKPQKIVTPEGRLSFPNLFTPVAGMGDNKELKYDCVILMPKDADITELRNAVSETALAKWPTPSRGAAVGHRSSYRSPIRDGDEKAHVAGYKGCWYMRFSSRFKPVVLDSRGKQIDDAAAIKAGDYVRISCTAFAFDTKGNRGVAFGLANVLWVKQGEGFGGTGGANNNPHDDFGSFITSGDAQAVSDDGRVAKF